MKRKRAGGFMRGRLINCISFLHASIWGRYFLCLILATGLVIGKQHFAEPLPIYAKCRLWTYGVIQRSLSLPSTIDAPVSIVDIASIAKEDPKKVAPPESPGEETATSRSALLALLTRIAAAHPASIAIDVDFSATSNGNPIYIDDDKFFASCRMLSERLHVPIFLGVDRHASDQKSADWLGQGNEGLAVGLAIGNDRYQGESSEMEGSVNSVLRMFCWTQVSGAQTKLPTLAYATGKSARATSQELARPFSWLIEAESDFDPAPSLKTRGFLVDYRLIDKLLTSSTPEKEVGSSTDAQFRGRVVILGLVRKIADDGRTLSRPDDLFRVPGRKSLYSGVLLHGCAVDTIVRAPLRQWTPTGRIASDILLTLFANTLVELLTWLTRKRRKHHQTNFRIYWWVTAISIFLLAIVVIPLVGYVRLVWDDGLIVGLVLILHTSIDHWLVRKVHQLEHVPITEHEEPTSSEPTAESHEENP